jgi:SPP1 gp7 family putative phage head morphogenesis protein
MARRHFEEEHEKILEPRMSANKREFFNRKSGTARRAPTTHQFVGARRAVRFASITWEPKSWQEALQYLLGLMPMSARDAKKLDAAMRRYSFGIADIESTRILELVKAAMGDAIAAGITVGEFRKRVDALFDSEGLTRLSRHHIENVFHTNLHSAYSAGNWQALHDPEIEEYFPFFQYLTADDESVRRSHAAMQRFVARRDDPVWLKWWPPNGYRCRCRVVAIDKYTAERKHIEPSMYPGFEPDEGFEGTPMDYLGLAA